jgi:tetratricopeptide (TPR) repeat protein
VPAAHRGGPGCAYLNTFYNAEQAYDEGVRLRASAGDSLSLSARAAFQRAAEKSAVVLDRHTESAFVDDALLLMGRSFSQLGRHGDASATFRRLLERFPQSGLVPQARLELARSERLLGDFTEAQAALGALVEDPQGVDPAELLYERGLIDLGRGDHAAAVASLRELLREHPEFARERKVAMRFADAELAAGEYEAAIEAYGAYRSEAVDPLERERVTLRVARALSSGGREADAIATYEDLLGQTLPDTLRARVHAERGELHAAAERWDDAEADFRRAAELAPGTLVASRATLQRGRIEWRARRRREPAVEILLDAYLHAPASAPADTASREARALGRIVHYQRIAAGDEVVAGLDDPALVRSTALYRLAEEVREVEKDAAGAGEIFDRVVAEYADSPWAPWALLAGGLLAREAGRVADGDARLERLVAWKPDHPAADSARRALGLPVPAREGGFYAEPEVLASLSRALPRPKDPMISIADQMDRYATRDATAGLARRGAVPRADDPGAAEEPPPAEVPPDRELPPGVTP